MRLKSRVWTSLKTLTAGALTLVASAGARAETVVITEPVPYAAAPAYTYEAPAYAYQAPAYAYRAPAYAYEAYAYGAPVIGRTIVTRPSIAVVPQTRTVVVQRPPGYVIERPAGVVAAPHLYENRRPYVAPSRGLVAVDTTFPAPCSVDLNGFERCY
jgi:hypothetical protein